ncbi:unnamed protein product [Rodentolepis nana]|uniref:Synaptotagmin n=1 Tax=Rodentolepis nana TaxID=102285 RepID=A0A0R3TYL6_RODNA|nr:unnamed protein product [Rodentolepis nana]
MAPLSTQDTTESSEAAHSAISTNHASVESTSDTSSQNAKIQEQVKVVINDLAKKMHVPPSAVIAMIVGFALFLLLILYCICKRGIFKRHRKDKTGKKKVDIKSVQLLGKQLGKDQVVCCHSYSLVNI